MKKLITLFCALMVLTMLSANNITITNIKLTGQNTTSQYTMVQFNLSWDNSWRISLGRNNWDAAWVFVKYRATVASGGDGLWKHATLDATGYSAPAGSTIAPAADGTGAFIYRNANGSGTFSLSDLQLQWNYGTNGVADNTVLDVKVFAIEMVYVPQGAFTLGSGGTEVSAFYKYPTTTNTYPVSSEAAITVGTIANALYYPSSLFGGDQAGPIPADFPKGYNAFYCMKYEISQQGYVDFLNTLTPTQASSRYSVTSTGYRYGITESNGVFSSTYPYVACSFLNWGDVAAYLDWSGLRPMTELEFEKACRGPVVPAADEYAWGNTTITQNTGITNSGLANETSTNGGNATYGNNASVQGPMRVGAFATSGSTRVTAGATYFGIMEMSGDLWKRAITAGNTTGRAFTGTHGDGALTSTGDADANTWPVVSTAEGACFRGGYWSGPVIYLQVSDRSQGARTVDGRYANYGGRGIRTAP